MPEYDEGEPPIKVVVSLRSMEDKMAFADLLGVTLTEKSKSTWWPAKEQDDLSALRFE